MSRGQTEFTAFVAGFVGTCSEGREGVMMPKIPLCRSAKFTPTGWLVFAVLFTSAVMPGRSRAADRVDVHGTDASDAAERPIRRALAFLAAEVPAWRKEHGCYSCHNNGDAARALLVARETGHPLKADVLADTIAWLEKPEEWHRNGGEGDFDEQDLSTLQFGAALAEAVRVGAIDDPKPLDRAAKMVAKLQRADGSWQMNASGTLGGPINYGDAVATTEALRVLRRVKVKSLRPHIERGERWLREITPKNVLDAAALLQGLHDAQDPAALRQRRACMELISRGENKNGGWGPTVNSAPEPYDTAMVLLALGGLADDARTRRMIERGRRYLIETQFEDGSWPETTRPPNAVSYAHRLSTTGWATRALLATTRKPDL